MKKLILLTILFLSITSLHAQISLGVKAGLNYSKLVDNTDYESNNYQNVETDFKIAYHFGMYANYELTDKWSLSGELLLSNKGFKTDDYRLNLIYMNLPVLVNYHVTEKIRLHLGPELGYRISAKGKDGSTSYDVGDYYNKTFDVGAAVGADFLLTDNFMLTARYTHGLLTTLDGLAFTSDGVNSTTIDSRVLNRCFQLSLSYSIFN